jgi:hypothetical protein
VGLAGSGEGRAQAPAKSPITIERASLLCPISGRKEPCDGQQRNEDQNANRKVIDHDRTFSQWPSVQVKNSVGEDNAKAVVSAMPVVMAMAGARITAIFSWQSPFFHWSGDCLISASTYRDRHHVLELLVLVKKEAAVQRPELRKENTPPMTTMQPNQSNKSWESTVT